MVPLAAIESRTPLFFYGTLMDPEILASVLERQPSPQATEAGWIVGYRRFYVRGETYPSLIHAGPEDRVHGTLYRPRSASEIARLNRFEGEEYRALIVEVKLSSGRRVASWAYFAIDPLGVSTEEWSFETWQRRDKARFLQDHAGWCRYRPTSPKTTK